MSAVPNEPASDHALRIAPLRDDELDDDQRAVQAATRRTRSTTVTVPGANWSNVLLRHPDLLRSWWPYTELLLDNGLLPHRTRELVILRIAYLCRGSYEWAAHIEMSREFGVSDDDIKNLRLGSAADAWDDTDRITLRATEELFDTARISAETWAGLAEIFSAQQLVEFPFLVGHYQSLAYALNSWGVWVPGLD